MSTPKDGLATSPSEDRVQDPEAIAEGMHQILSNETTRQRLIARGRIRAASFSWKTSVERVLRIYREVSAAS